jgi:hypothetical protein
VEVEEKALVFDALCAAGSQVGMSESRDPGVGQKDLALAISLAEEPQSSARQIYIGAFDSHNLIDPNPGRDHQGDGKQCRRLMGLGEDANKVSVLVDTGSLTERPQQSIQFVPRDDSRKPLWASDLHRRVRPRVARKQATGRQPVAETTKARGASPDRCGLEASGTLFVDEAKQTILVNPLDRGGAAEVSLQGRYVTVVSAYGVRRKIPSAKKPSDVPLACLTDLHRWPPPLSFENWNVYVGQRIDRDESRHDSCRSSW